MKPFIIWAYIKWCFFNIFGGMISKHFLFIKTMRREPLMAILLSILLGTLSVGASVITALLIGPSDIRESRELASSACFFTAVVVASYVALVAVIASWKNFCDDRNELFDILKK
jgi:hypothetical protein